MKRVPLPNSAEPTWLDGSHVDLVKFGEDHNVSPTVELRELVASVSRFESSLDPVLLGRWGETVEDVDKETHRTPHIVKSIYHFATKCEMVSPAEIFGKEEEVQ